MNKTKIEWCDSTLNPVVGCTYGCDFCYAKRMNDRFKWVEDFNKPMFFPERLDKLNSKKPQNIFMDSMSDIADWTADQFKEVWKSIAKNPQHNYLFLTKRPEVYDKSFRFSCSNVWCGATVINQEMAYKMLSYLSPVARMGCNTFLSIEPILGEINMSDRLRNINWVIIGAETGNRKDKVVPKAEWITKIKAQCKINSIPVFMKESLLPIVGEENMLREFPKGLKKISCGI